jgi:hypothetical protein
MKKGTPHVQIVINEEGTTAKQLQINSTKHHVVYSE